MPDPTFSSTRRALARSLAKSLALVAATPALTGAGLALGQATPAATLSPTPTPVPTPEAPSSAAEALTEIVRIRWGKNLSGDQLGEIAKTVDGRLKGAEAMKKVKLTNADEPDIVFFAETEGGR